MLNKKKMLGAMAMAVAIPAVIVPVSANVDQVEVENEVTDFMVKSVTDGVEITAYKGSSKDVIIPNTIGGKSVVGIGDLAFSRKGIESIIFPEGLKYIGEKAFESNKITKVYLPKSVKEVEAFAFKENHIEDLKIQAEKTATNEVYIRREAFSYNKLTTIELPPSVVDVQSAAFVGNKVEKLIINGSRVKFWDSNKGDRILSTDMGLEIDLVYGDGVWRVIAPIFDGVKLKTVTIPPTVKAISNSSFKGSGLTEIKLPEGLEEIGNEAFQNTKLGQLKVPSTVKTIGASAFQSAGITSLDLPDKLETVGARAFRNNKIENVKLPSTVKLEKESFSRNNIKSIYIPRTIKNVTNDFLDENQLEPKNLNIWGELNTRAHDIAIEKGYTFNEGEMPEEPGTPPTEEPEEPSEPEETPQWSFDTPDAPYMGGKPTVTTFGGKIVEGISMEDFKWVTKEEVVETEFGNIILKPTETGTVVEIPEGLGDENTDEVIKVKYKGQHFMTIKIVKKPKIDFNFGL